MSTATRTDPDGAVRPHVGVPERMATAADLAAPAGFLGAPWGAHRPGPVQAALIALGRRTFLRRARLRLWMARLVARLGAPVDVTFRGCRYRVDGRRNLIEAALMINPAYNARDIDFLLDGLPEGGTAVDIGSNIGLYTLPLAARAGLSGRAIGIDANPGMSARLEFNAAASGLTQVVGVTAAVSDCAGVVELVVHRDDLAIVAVRETGGGTIRMCPLADILADLGVTRVDVLKIDIEGYEDRALAPWLRTAPEAMLPARIVIERVERDRDYPACAAAFAARGYVLAGRTRNNSLYRRDQPQAGGSADERG